MMILRRLRRNISNAPCPRWLITRAVCHTLLLPVSYLGTQFYHHISRNTPLLHASNIWVTLMAVVALSDCVRASPRPAWIATWSVLAALHLLPVALWLCGALAVMVTLGEYGNSTTARHGVWWGAGVALAGVVTVGAVWGAFVADLVVAWRAVAEGCGKEPDVDIGMGELEVEQKGKVREGEEGDGEEICDEKEPLV
ncbi:hypothetical protein EDC01DRAFT_678417 [Geopyxis carbonaria]|nr:hypothetical protein EDC01DRAFT_678417 [Geopyxis carbonaria]